MSSTLKLIDSQWSSSHVEVGESVTQSFHLVLDEGFIPVIQTQSELNYLGKITQTDVEIIEQGEQVEFVWNLTWLVLDQEEAQLVKHFIKVYDQQGLLVEEYQVKTTQENFPVIESLKFEKTIQEELMPWAPQDEVSWSPWWAALLLLVIPIVYSIVRIYRQIRLVRTWKAEQTISKLKTLLGENSQLEALSQVRNDLFSMTHNVLKQIYFPENMGDTWSQTKVQLSQFDFESFNSLDELVRRNSSMRVHKGAELSEMNTFHARVLESLELLDQLHEWSYRSKQQSLTLGSQFEEASYALRAWANCLEAHRV